MNVWGCICDNCRVGYRLSYRDKEDRTLVEAISDSGGEKCPKCGSTLRILLNLPDKGVTVEDHEILSFHMLVNGMGSDEERSFSAEEAKSLLVQGEVTEADFRNIPHRYGCSVNSMCVRVPKRNKMYTFHFAVSSGSAILYRIEGFRRNQCQE